jgi:hypothetical protein
MRKRPSAVGRGAPAITDHQASFLDRSRTVVMPVGVHAIKAGPVLVEGMKNIDKSTAGPGSRTSLPRILAKRV